MASPRIAARRWRASSAWHVHYLRGIRADVRTTKEALDALAESFQNAHGKGHGDPCPGTAVVTDPKPLPKPALKEEPSPEPAPVAVRSALLPNMGSLPSAQADEDDGDRETPEEGTRLYKRSAVPLPKKRPTLLGGLAGAPQEPGPKPDRPSSPTLVSPGNEPRSGETEIDDGSIIVEAQDMDGNPLSDEVPSPPPSGPRKK